MAICWGGQNVHCACQQIGALDAISFNAVSLWKINMQSVHFRWDVCKNHNQHTLWACCSRHSDWVSGYPMAVFLNAQPFSLFMLFAGWPFTHYRPKKQHISTKVVVLKTDTARFGALVCVKSVHNSSINRSLSFIIDFHLSILWGFPFRGYACGRAINSSS